MTKKTYKVLLFSMGCAGKLVKEICIPSHFRVCWYLVGENYYVMLMSRHKLDLHYFIKE
jgi:hypothetical protein